MPVRHKKFKFSPTYLVVIILALIIVTFTIYFQLSSKVNNSTTEPLPTPLPSASLPNTLTGSYKGLLPCADCTGIEETLTLAGNPDSGTYIMEDVYQGKSINPFRSNGTWTKVDTSIIKLIDSETSNPSYYKIGDSDNLIMLNSDMQTIDSPFNQTLTKQF